MLAGFLQTCCFLVFIPAEAHCTQRHDEHWHRGGGFDCKGNVEIGIARVKAPQPRSALRPVAAAEVARMVQTWTIRYVLVADIGGPQASFEDGQTPRRGCAIEDRVLAVQTMQVGKKKGRREVD